MTNEAVFLIKYGLQLEKMYESKLKIESMKHLDDETTEKVKEYGKKPILSF